MQLLPGCSRPGSGDHQSRRCKLPGMPLAYLDCSILVGWTRCCKALLLLFCQAVQAELNRLHELPELCAAVLGGRRAELVGLTF